MQREKKIISGKLLEIDIYPVFDNGNRIPTRSPKSKPSTEEQRKYNNKKAIKKFIRLANANFDNTDYIMHPTYSPDKAPQSEEQARKDIVNYFRRVKTKRTSEVKKLNKELASVLECQKQIPNNKYISDTVIKIKKKIEKLEEPLKYIYVIEKQTYKTGKNKGRNNWHFHLFVSGGLSDKDMEQLWTNGIRVNCDNYQPDKFGPETAAKYMSKDPQGNKRFSYSKNLIKPIEKIKDGKYTRKAVDRIAIERIDDTQFWERKYKGYKFIRTYTRWNDYNGHWYISAIMYKADGTDIPSWNEEEWITSDY